MQSRLCLIPETGHSPSHPEAVGDCCLSLSSSLRPQISLLSSYFHSWDKRPQDGGQISESRPPNTTVPWERSSLDPSVDPNVIPRNTHNEIEGNPLGI